MSHTRSVKCGVDRALSVKTIGVIIASMAAIGLTGVSPCSACGIDGIPSMSANGTLVQRNTTVPKTPHQVSQWSPFIVHIALHVGRSATFTENKKELAQTLPPVVMTRPWRWLLGDGTISYGWTVHHAYTRAGRWLVIADAYVQESHRWEPFDQAIVVVR